MGSVHARISLLVLSVLNASQGFIDSLTVIVGYFEYIKFFWKIYEKVSFLACNCIGPGTINSSCDSNGICFCKTNFIGSKCTKCKPGYYGFPDCYCKACDLYHCFVNFD